MLKKSIFTLIIAATLFACNKEDAEPDCALNNSKVTTPDFTFCVSNVDGNFQQNSSTGSEHFYLTIQEVVNSRVNREFKMTINSADAFETSFEGTLTELIDLGYNMSISFSSNQALVPFIKDADEFRLSMKIDKAAKTLSLNATGEMFFLQSGGYKSNEGNWSFVINDFTYQ